MLLIHLLKILFWILIIRHSIRWVSYHIHHHNKKERIYHGNTRMPKDVMLALLYGINGKPKIRFKDLSYRKSLAEWWQLINNIYPPDNELTITSQTHANSKLVTPASRDSTTQIQSNGNFKNGNRKQFPFPQLKNTNPAPLLFFLGGDKAYVGSRGGQCLTLHNTSCITNLKNSENPILSAKQTSACT
jgi:hypothetical protein